MSLSVHLIGPYPPPFGGVSTHLNRLHNRLRQDGYGSTVWSRHDAPGFGLRRLPSSAEALWGLANDSEGIFHFHGHHFLAGQLAELGCQVLFTVHNERINEDLARQRSLREWWINRRTRGAFRKVPKLLAVSERARAELLRFGFPHEAVTMIPAYLRPGPEETAHPDNLESFNTFRRSYRYVLSACASSLKRHHGVDLYGIDLCVAMLGRLVHSRPEVGLVLALPGLRGSRDLEELKEQIRRLGVAQNVLLLQEEGAYHPLLMQTDLFLRPTNTDGFSISIAEAFEYGIPVIASDAVPRPDGCLLFTNRDLDDFTVRTCEALDNLAALRQGCARHKVPDRYAEIVTVYRALTAEPGGYREAVC